VAETTAGKTSLPPRVLIVMPDQWPRALLRAALREVGYDAVGTQKLRSALRIRADEPDRGPVRLVIVDQSALSAGDAELRKLLAAHGMPPAILLARATLPAPVGPWKTVLRRPVSVAEIVAAAQTVLPLRPADRHPVD
jgi:DNA-binding response OmpR family regulator